MICASLFQCDNWRLLYTCYVHSSHGRCRYATDVLHMRHTRWGHTQETAHIVSCARSRLHRLTSAYSFLSSQGKLAEADSLYLRAIGIGKKSLGPKHPSLAKWLHNRGVALESQVGATHFD